MKRWLPMIAAAALVASTPHWGSASGPFEQRLSQDRQIMQALNRLTFGPRPGDVEEVRRLGVAKWIELQLHPDRIPENPGLDEKLKPLETLRMNLPEIVEKYTPQQPRRPPRVQKVYGKWPGLEKEQLIEGRDLAVTTDYRDVLGELIRGHLGQRDLGTFFPGYQPCDPLALLRA